MAGEPFALARIVACFLVWALAHCVIGVCGWQLKALLDKKELARNTFKGGELHATDLITLSALSCAFASVSGVILAVLIAYSVFRRHRSHSRGELRAHVISNKFQTGLFAGLCFALLPIAIANTVVVAVRSARVTAPGIPKRVVDRALEFAHISLKYNSYKPDIGFAICTWLLWLSLLVATVVSLVAMRAAHRLENNNASYKTGQAHSPENGVYQEAKPSTVYQETNRGPPAV